MGIRGLYLHKVWNCTYKSVNFGAFGVVFLWGRQNDNLVPALLFGEGRSPHSPTRGVDASAAILFESNALAAWYRSNNVKLDE